MTKPNCHFIDYKFLIESGFKRQITVCQGFTAVICEKMQAACGRFVLRINPIQPQVSVCLPVFNGERFLSAAIESTLAQSEPHFELLISDDASTDASWQIIQEYARSERRIKCWQNQSNLGLFKNYNVCMEQASGEYIKLFAQDDLLEPTAPG